MESDLRVEFWRDAGARSCIVVGASLELSSTPPAGAEPARPPQKDPPGMMLVPTYLAPSPIEGLGVFTRVAIPKDSLVWRFERRFDQVIALADITTMPPHVQEFVERYSYPLPSDPETHVVLDADEGRFMNHADEPNCTFPPDGETGWANRDIAAGEELTCHYACFTLGAITFQPPRHRLDHDLSLNGTA